MTATQDTPVNAPTTIDAGPLALSARIREPRQQPRGVIVALHGGTYDSGYYDTGAGSLLDLAATLGYLVVAVDRPGYGATHGADPELLTFDAQTTILSQALLRVWTDIGQGAGLVLIGHSIGGMLALCVAATRPAVPLQGVEVSGMGDLWQPGLREMWGSLIGDAAEVTVPADAHNQVMYGPEGTFDAARQAAYTALQRPIPMPELIDVVAWSDRLPSVAAAIEVPVRATLAEHDNIWQSDKAARTVLRQRFTRSPSIRVESFPGAGHSIELHRGARAYVLRQLAFAEECLSALSGAAKGPPRRRQRPRRGARTASAATLRSGRSAPLSRSQSTIEEPARTKAIGLRSRGRLSLPGVMGSRLRRRAQSRISARAAL